MKKILFIALALGLYLNWAKVERYIHPKPAHSAQMEVVLYATDWCGYCKATRALLEKEGVAYTEFDIEKSEHGRKIHKALGGHGVPLLDIDGILIHGYDEQKILAALAQPR